MIAAERIVAVLFARSDSVYKTITDCDVWDIERDARNWPGGHSVIAHPPCRAWGRLRNFAKPRQDEKSLAVWAVRQVQKWGGVLEHPAQSSLWKETRLPAIGKIDEFGGWTLPVDQNWWGHRARKRTYLYIVGVKPRCIPQIPLSLEVPTHVVAKGKKRKGMAGYRPQLGKAEREHTPLEFAIWLRDLAMSCHV